MLRRLYMNLGGRRPFPATSFLKICHHAGASLALTFCLYTGRAKVHFHLFYLLFYKGTLSLLGQFNWAPKQPVLLTQVVLFFPLLFFLLGSGASEAKRCLFFAFRLQKGLLCLLALLICCQVMAVGHLFLP